MTGTIVSSADEINEKYNLDIVELPTNKKCIRIDQKDSLYITMEAKNKAVLREINKMYLLKRPILVATSSIEESILLAKKLESLNIKCQVLNAKNDEEEAEIIAEAGDLGAVTISTNMAGRGTDIKLGGRDERNRNEVMKLGGLYVIATNRHDSLRIDNQLRGRAGRQGDCGESKFFISLEDDLLLKFALYKFIPKELYPVNKEDPIVHKTITRQIDVAQRIAQGNSRRIRKNITNYSMILERHRLEIYDIRKEILIGNKKKEIMKENLPIRYEELYITLGEVAINKAETQILLYLIGRYWSYYLENAAYLRQTINIVNLGHKNPVQEYDIILHNNFREMLEQILQEAIKILADIRIGKNGIDMEEAGMGSPTSTLTFLLDDSAEALGIDNIFKMASLFLGPIVIPLMIYKKIMDRKGLKEKNQNILKCTSIFK
ncbi:MAG: preprotein translocase subunit SecA [Mobilitalea sp.]